VVITAFYVFTFWLLGVAYGGDVIKGGTGFTCTFTFDAAPSLRGSLGEHDHELARLSSIFACLLASTTGSPRYLFALGRSGLMAPKLGLSHGQHESPYVASVSLRRSQSYWSESASCFVPNPTVQMYARHVRLRHRLPMLVLYACGSLSVLGYLRRKDSTSDSGTA